MMNALRPASTIDIGPLSWVIEEVRASLGQAVGALKALAADPQDTTQLRFATTHLHQAHGALQIVDLDGISLITGAAEQLFALFENDVSRCDAKTIALVERAFNGLLDYLDDLLSGNPHQPVRLFAHYRALLDTVGADRIHPADLFFPDVGTRISDDAPHVSLGPEELHQCRSRFERGLLGYLRGADRLTAAGDMTQSVRVLRGSLPTTGAARSFWSVMDAFLTSLESGAEPDINVKRLCARLNLQMRRTIEGSTSIAERLLRDALFYIAVADSPSPVVHRVKRSFSLDGLVPSDYLATRYGRIDAQLIRRAKDQLSNLKAAWDRLIAGQANDAVTAQRHANGFVEIVKQMDEPALERIATILAEVAKQCVAVKAIPSETIAIETATAVLFVENTLDTFNRLDSHFPERATLIADRLEQALAGQTPDMSVDWLADLSRKSLERSTMATLVAEIQTNMRAVEQALDAFFRDANKRDGLASTDALLAQTAGALMLLGEQSATEALELGRAAIGRFMDPEYKPEPGEFERVAQTFGALGFFIDALRQPDTASRPSLELDATSGAYVARMVIEPPARDIVDDVVPISVPPTVIATTPGLMALPDVAPVVRTAPKVEPPVAPASDEAREASDATEAESGAELPMIDASFVGSDAMLAPIDFGAMPDEPLELDSNSVERETSAHVEKAAALVEQLRAAPTDQDAVARLKDELSEIVQGSELLDQAKNVTAARDAERLLDQPLDTAALDQLAATVHLLSGIESPKDAPAPDAATLALAASDDTVIDAELLEIFLAEAKEVFDTVDDALQKAITSPSNREHLTTLRRAFHTLKGSSRMVGLRVFGEAAWAIEQVYNVWLS
ncbi:MAG TPA: Hpt domain-containing protein, partial [Burkholderiaceae bacterium]|nr:Hpt domain-containing protein [Burkholderiaceae bacterium]